jgi:transposase-like protein
MTQTAIRRKLSKELQERAWEMYCNCVSQNQIARQLDVGEATVSRWIRKKQESHPAASMTPEQFQADAFVQLQSAGLMLRTEAAGYRQRGEPIPPGVLNMISLHSDRFARWATRLSAVPTAVLEVNQTNQFDSSLWAGLLGANAQAPLADASAVDCAQIEPAQANEGQPDVRVPAEVTGTQALIPGLDS